MFRHLIIRFSSYAFVRRITRNLRLHILANRYLASFPVIRRLPHGVQYRATRLESIPLAAEMFEKGSLYPAELLPKKFSSFADLGCNVGYFACWIADMAEGKKLNGLLVDANPDAVKEANWHMDVNGLRNVFALDGIVGEGKEGTTAEFYLYESNICSTSHLPSDFKTKLDGKWKRIFVPCLDIGKEWKLRFGETRCNILKIDIEGSELKFLQSEQAFLSLCDTIFIEWHNWAVKFDQIKFVLESYGFLFVKAIDENEEMGTAIFRRP
jgi:FkbM family methyltransferase